MKSSKEFIIRNAKEEEFSKIGKLLVEVYANLQGFPTPDEQPKYYEMLSGIGEFSRKPAARLLVAVESADEKIAGAVVYFGDMKYYGSGGIATKEANCAGFRLLGVDAAFRGCGVGKKLSIACIELAEKEGADQLIIHTTEAMKTAWTMYEKLGFERSIDLDFLQQGLSVYGFRLRL